MICSIQETNNHCKISWILIALLNGIFYVMTPIMCQFCVTQRNSSKAVLYLEHTKQAAPSCSFNAPLSESLPQLQRKPPTQNSNCAWLSKKYSTFLYFTSSPTITTRHCTVHCSLRYLHILLSSCAWLIQDLETGSATKPKSNAMKTTNLRYKSHNHKPKICCW